jgi:hypothetical protein
MTSWRRVLVMPVALLAGTLACSGDRKGEPGGSGGASSSGAAGSPTSGAPAAGLGGTGGTGGFGGTGGAIAVGGSSARAGASSSGNGGTGGSSGNGGDSSPLYCYEQDADICICTVDEAQMLPPSTAVCANYEDRYCCADPSYPESGFCSCNTWGCIDYDAYCDCNFFPGGPSTLSCSPSFMTCCRSPLNPYACVCLNGSCPDGTEQVESCVLDDVGCEHGGLRVPGCN